MDHSFTKLASYAVTITPVQGRHSWLHNTDLISGCAELWHFGHFKYIYINTYKLQTFSLSNGLKIKLDQREYVVT